jgi:hypothetical protein
MFYRVIAPECRSGLCTRAWCNDIQYMVNTYVSLLVKNVQRRTDLSRPDIQTAETLDRFSEANTTCVGWNLHERSLV